MGEPLAEPLGHALGLALALRRQRALQVVVDLAHLEGLGVAPQDQVHQVSTL